LERVRRSAVGKGQEAEAVRELMREHGDEVDIIAVVAVEAEVEEMSSEAGGISEVDIEIALMSAVVLSCPNRRARWACAFPYQ